MTTLKTALLTLAVVLGLAATALAEEHIQWDGPKEKRDPGPGETIISFNEYDDSFAWDALERLSGQRPAQGLSRGEMAQLVLAELEQLPQYGQKQTQEIRPAIPAWFLDGYSAFQPTSLQRSRYFNNVIGGLLEPQADIASLYAHWSAYDAEWFSVVRRPGYKAWLSATLLTYAPTWPALKGEPASQLHERLVRPLQTKDDPYKELDNWINNFSDSPDAFIKPLVLSALSGELAGRGGLEVDSRFIDKDAYDAGFPPSLGLSEEEFMLLGALTVTYFREIYDAAPGTKQPLHFRDYFIERFREKSGL